MDCRIFSTPKIKRDVEKQYKATNISQQYFDRLHFIDNKVDIPAYREESNAELQVLFVGRGAPQKRVYLIDTIARKMKEQKRPVHFSYVGDVEKIIPESSRQFCTFYGNINDERELHKIYQQSDVLILTSSYEGLPIAVMDMMARGKVIVSTAIDGIPDYITHQENGLLITETDEAKIVEQGVDLLELLIKNPELKKKIGSNSYSYAVKHFSGETFCGTFRKILTNEK
jgi:glycosyltransferase involved in cell wall biosynthesis